MSDAEIEAKFRLLAEPVLKDPNALLGALWELEKQPSAGKVLPLIALSLGSQ
jgi:hypothetical protein